MAGLAFAADDLAAALELVAEELVRGHDLIECVRDLARETELIAGEAHGEVAVAHGLKCAQQFSLAERRVLRRGRRARRPPDLIWISHGVPP